MAATAVTLGMGARNNLNRFFSERSWQELANTNTPAAARYALAGMELSPVNAQYYHAALAGVLHATNESLVPLEHSGGVKMATFSPSGDLLATASRDGTARIWNTTDGELVETLTGHTDQVNSAVVRWQVGCHSKSRWQRESLVAGNRAGRFPGWARWMGQHGDVFPRRCAAESAHCGRRHDCAGVGCRQRTPVGCSCWPY